jgi:energy-coupling factor transporter ATP-binding protein EcfA2
MKRITNLEISNYRAFHDVYLIELPKGENLLIYGENGSGKSSLFKSVNNFLASSRNPAFPYTKSYYKQAEEGLLNFVFNEFNPNLNQITSNFGEIISFGSAILSTNTSAFVRDAELIKGFLDYRSLLEVYNHPDAKPNLFNLIVCELLKNFIPIGVNYPLGEKWLQLENDLKTSYSRRGRNYTAAIAALPAFEINLNQSLKGIFLQLNVFLIKYFKLNLRVWYTLLPTHPIINPAIRQSWRNAIKDLRLEIKLGGVVINNQSDFINEARFSALAICLYLAALKRNPQLMDYKVLFLDDVFIGLDTSNRLPILEIIKNEFQDYQVFISTYDKHLFELARRKFETETPNKWKSVELYVGQDTITKKLIEKPILITGQTNFEKGSQYLHDRQKPDYPAAANYFRKALEEIIQDYIPRWETTDSDNTQIPTYQLTSLAQKTKKFLEKTGNNSISIVNIIGLLPALLHPLSHHEIASPVYKGELLSIEANIIKLKQLLTDIDISNNFKCGLGHGKRVKITFTIDAAANHYSYYELILKESLTLKRNGAATPIISKIHCVADRCYGHNGVVQYPSSNLDKKNQNFNYESLVHKTLKLTTL